MWLGENLSSRVTHNSPLMLHNIYRKYLAHKGRTGNHFSLDDLGTVPLVALRADCKVKLILEF
jgi:hypothetical protein